MDIYRRGEKREVAGELKQTRITKHVVDLDWYTVMNAQYMPLSPSKKRVSVK